MSRGVFGESIMLLDDWSFCVINLGKLGVVGIKGVTLKFVSFWSSGIGLSFGFGWSV